MIRTRARLIAATLLIGSAAAFALGTALERNSATGEGTTPPVPSVSAPSTLPASSPMPASAAAGDADGGHDGGTPQTGDTAALPPSVTRPLDNDADSGQHGPAGAASAAHDRSEQLLGINPEAPGLVVVAVAVSLLFAAGILTIGSPVFAAVTAAAMLAFTVLDIREVIHQIGESRPGLAAFAAVVALLHLLAAVAAAVVARSPCGKRTPASTT